MPNCTVNKVPFSKLKRGDVDVRFDGGDVSSDGGLLLLREVERRQGLLRKVAQIFPDPRNPALVVEHITEHLLRQRVFGLCQGYEDLDRYFSAYYNNYCFLPLYVFCGEQLLAAYLRPASRDAGHCPHHQTRAIFHQHMPLVTQDGRRVVALAVQPRIRVRCRSVRVVASLFAFPVSLRVARPAARRLIPAILANKALVAGPRLDQRAVDREMFFDSKPFLSAMVMTSVKNCSTTSCSSSRSRFFENVE